MFAQREGGRKKFYFPSTAVAFFTFAKAFFTLIWERIAKMLIVWASLSWERKGTQRYVSKKCITRALFAQAEKRGKVIQSFLWQSQDFLAVFAFSMQMTWMQIFWVKLSFSGENAHLSGWLIAFHSTLFLVHWGEEGRKNKRPISGLISTRLETKQYWKWKEESFYFFGRTLTQIHAE